MKERPILFSGPMVRDILDGTKTQTRREITRLLKFGEITEFQRSATKGYDWSFRDRSGCWNDISHERLLECCPYGKPGDRLWVKETWGQVGEGDPIIYRATCDTETRFATNWYDRGFKWTPSIHMPRRASRITLEITDIRVERLQDISEEDTLAEGVAIDKGHCYHVAGHEGKWAHATAKGCFETLWGSINGPGSWDANPWVWVIEFRKVKGGGQ